MGDGVRISPAVPILRMFDVEATIGFYCDYLGFTKDWEHRFEPGFPLYVQVSRSEMTLHLSEHYGDGSPNTALWIPVDDVVAFQAELIAKEHGYSRPGIEDHGPGGPTMTITDPSGNLLRFAQPS